MKKGFWGVILLLLVSTLAMAKVNFGLQVHGGLSLSRYKNYSFKNSKLSSLGGQFNNKVGAGGGIAGRLWFGKLIGMSLGVQVNQGGNIRKVTNKTGGTQVYTLEDRINYITIPLVAHIGWGNEAIRIFGTAGGYYAFAFSGKYHNTNVQNGILLSDEEGDIDFDNTYTRTDAGVRFGVGMEAYVSKDRKHGVTLDITYDWGLSKILQDDIQYKNHTYRFTNSRTLIQVGYIVRFGEDTPGKKNKKPEAPELPEIH